MFMDMLRKLRAMAEARAAEFQSRGFTALFAMLRQESDDTYFARVQLHLKELKFSGGILVGAELGRGNEGTNYVLRLERDKRPPWLKRILGKGPPSHTFHIADRDEAGARALSELRDRGIHVVAKRDRPIHRPRPQLLRHAANRAGILCRLPESSRQARSFGGADVLSPAAALQARQHRATEIYDVGLALNMGRRLVGNALEADGKSLVIITGANQGGKSSFLRGVGLAQLMMQCGMFVGAESFGAEVCTGLFTHYKREEDPTMRSGKLDEELRRMSEIADTIASGSWVLFNESFASTNEREGSEIASEVVSAMIERGIRVLFVTHLYEFAHAFFVKNRPDSLFLRAERLADGTRTFKLGRGEPQESSHGQDLYHEVFAAEA